MKTNHRKYQIKIKALYQKSRKNLERFCFTCEKPVEGPLWYKDLNNKDRCRLCYEKNRVKETIEKVCFRCKKIVKSHRWYKDPDNKKEDCCRSCYDKTRVKEPIEKFCFTCKKNCKSPRWHKDPNDNAKDRCQICYDQIHYQNKKRKKSHLFNEFTPESFDFYTCKSPEEDYASQATSYLELYSKRKNDSLENSSNELQYEIFPEIDYLLYNNTHLDNNLSSDLVEFDSHPNFLLDGDLEES